MVKTLPSACPQQSFLTVPAVKTLFFAIVVIVLSVIPKFSIGQIDAPDSRFVRGDVEQNGHLELGDAISILSHMFLGLRLSCHDTADLDDNGEIHLSDVIYLLSHLYLGSPPPQAPYPGCGADPSADDLPCSIHSRCKSGDDLPLRMSYGIGESTQAIYTEDNQKLIVASESGRVTILDAETFKVLHVVNALNEKPTVIDVDKSGIYVLVGDQTGKLASIHLAKGEIHYTLDFKKPLLAIATSFDHQDLLIAPDDHWIFQHNLETGERTAEYDLSIRTGSTNADVDNLIVIPGTTTIFARLYHRSYFLYDLATKTAGDPIEFRSVPIFLGAFKDPNSDRYIVASNPWYYSFDLRTLKTFAELTIEDDIQHHQQVYSFAENRKLMLRMLDHYEIRTFPEFSLQQEIYPHDSRLTTTAISPDETMLFSAAEDNSSYQLHFPRSIRQWDASAHRGPPQSLALSPDLSLLATGGLYGKLKIWDAADGRLLFQINAHPTAINDLQFSSDSRYLASSGSQQDWKIWDLTTGSLSFTHSLQERGLNSKISCFEWDSANQKVLIGTVDGEVLLLDTESHKTQYFSESSHDRGITALLISERDPHFYTASADGDIHIRNWDDGSLIQAIETQLFGIRSLDLSREKEFILISTDEGKVVEWEIETDRPRIDLQLEDAWLSGAYYTLNESHIATAGSRGLITFIKRDDLNSQSTIPTNLADIYSFKLSPTKDRILVGGSDGTVQMFPLKLGD